MTARENLSINLRYYRKIFNLSQEKFGEMVGSIDMLDKLADGLNKALNNENASSIRKELGYNEVTSDMLIKYQESNITNYKRIDER